MFSLILVLLLFCFLVQSIYRVLTMTNSIFVILGFVLGCAATFVIALIGLGFI